MRELEGDLLVDTVDVGVIEELDDVEGEMDGLEETVTVLEVDGEFVLDSVGIAVLELVAVVDPVEVVVAELVGVGVIELEDVGVGLLHGR